MRKNKLDLQSMIPIVFTIISILLSIILFFRVEKYSSSDLMRAALYVKKGDFNVMLFAVRPVLLLLAYIYILGVPLRSSHQ